MTDKFFFNVLALENILVALTREIGDGPCFLYIKFSCIVVWLHLTFSAIPFWFLVTLHALLTSCTCMWYMNDNHLGVDFFLPRDFLSQKLFEGRWAIKMGDGRRRKIHHQLNSLFEFSKISWNSSGTDCFDIFFAVIFFWRSEKHIH